MCSGRCPATPTRRGFLAASSAALGAPLLGLMSPQVLGASEGKGLASRRRPLVWGCFVRRKGDYGMRWPGAIYDGEAARKRYIQLSRSAADELHLRRSPTACSSSSSTVSNTPGRPPTRQSPPESQR